MKEFEYLSEKLSNPVQPYSFILGGLKVADKIKLIDNIMNNAEMICIGEGERAFVSLYNELEKIDFNLEEFKKNSIAVL